MGIFAFTRPAFAAAGFTEQEQAAWLSLGLSCAEAEAARADGLTPEAFRALSRVAQSEYRWRASLGAEAPSGREAR